MEYLVIILFALSLLAIFLFSLGQIHLVQLYKRARAKNSLLDRRANRVEAEPDALPMVTVQLPIYNEKYVAERVINACASLQYPPDRLEIQVLDDSDDTTSHIIRSTVDKWQAKGVDMTHIRRKTRSGFKAGALQEGLKLAKGHFLAVFDADFIPHHDFLLKTIPQFRDEKVGMVQTRWGHVNEDYSMLTQLQAFGLNAHFIIEQIGRSSVGSFINFNGTGGVWRKSCILDAGGWSADTLTEDLDLSYRAQLNGWKFVYLEKVEAPAELPVIMQAIKSQQFRWNKGAAETARKNLPRVLSGPFSFIRKTHAVMHLLNSSVFLPLLLAGILSIPILFVRYSQPQLKPLFHLGSVFFLGFLGIGYFYWVSAQALPGSKGIRYFIRNFPVFLSMSMGLSLHNSIAVLEGLFGKKSTFIRTPKFNVFRSGDSWKGNDYIRRGVSWVTVFEGVLSLYFLGGIIFGIVNNDYGLILFHVFLFAGFSMVFLSSMLPLRHARTQPK